MPDQYDEFLERTRLAKESREGSLTPTGGDPYDSFIDNVTRAKRVTLESSLNHGSKQDPDAKARALALSKHLQLPVETVEKDPENAARLARLGALDIDALRLESPTTAAWLENPNNAAIAHDDVDGLRQIERTARLLTPGEPEPDTPELRAAIEAQADRIWETLSAYRSRPVPPAPAPGAAPDGGPVTEEERNDPTRQLAADFGPVENRNQVIDVLRRSLRLPSLLPQEGLARAGLRSLESGIVRLAGGLTANPDWVDNANAMDEQAARRYAPATIGEKITGAVTGSIPAVAAIAVTRGRVAGAATSTAARTLRPDQIASLSKWLVPGEIAGLSLAQNVQDRNQSPGEAILNAVLEGAFTRAGGSFEPFLDAAGATGGKLAKEIGKEALEEGATSGSQDIVSQTLGKNAKPYDFLRTLEAAGLGAAAGTIFAGAFGIPRAMGDRYAKQANEAGAAQDHADTVKQLVDLVANSKTGQRAPDEVAALVEQTLGQSSRFLFIDSDAFRDAFADPAAAAKLLGVGEEYALALPARGQVQIPTARLVQVAAKNDAFKALLERYRRTPTSSSAMEAAEFEAKSPDALRQLQAEAKAATAEATKPDDNRRQVAEIEDELFRRMNEVHPPNVDRGALRDVAKALASNFGALSQRTGKTPSELFKVKLRGDMQRVMRGDKFDLFDSMLERLRSGDFPTDEAASQSEQGRELLAALQTLRDAMAEAGVDIGASNKEIRKALADLEERGGQKLNQGTTILPPKTNSLDIDALLRQWRKATGDRTPIGGMEAWQQLVEESAKVDEANGVELNQPAYHGTPHKFDKFTTDHMGTGEGAQAFGWGLYFAGKKEVAQYYKEALAADYLVDGKPVREATDEVYDALGVAVEGDEAVDQRIAELNDSNAQMQERAASNNKPLAQSYQRAIDSNKKEIAALERFRGRVTRGDGGRLYTVEIPEDGEYLLWDKPLSEQSEKVRNALDAERKIYRDSDGQQGAYISQTSGLNIYRELERTYGSDEAASKRLLALGIKGIKYLDGTSRADGDGSFNYVIFDGADVAITEYNQPGGKQNRRGSVVFTQGAGLGRPFLVNVFRGADVSTMLHEVGGHVMLEMLGDLASEPNAPADIVNDYRTIRDWFAKNAKDIRDQAIELATDAKDKAEVLYKLRAASDEDIAKIADNFRTLPTDPAAARLHEAMHEYFARGQEAYIMEGKAPTPAMRGVFARLAEWLKVLYRAAKNLRVNMSPEIVAVFDRLVAADDAVEEAEREAGIDVMLPRETFDTLEEWEKHQKAVAESRADARARTSTKLLAELNRESTRAWKAKRVEVEAEVERAVNEAPVYQAIAALQNGTTPDGVRLPDEYQGLKLDRADLVNQWGADVLKHLPGPENVSDNKANRGAFLYAETGGLPVDQVARMWGFASGDAMVEALIQADDRASVIRAETDKRMKELNPDPMTDGTLMDQAHAALATDKRAELLRAELNALGRRTGQTPAPIEVMRELARDRIAKVRGYDLAPDKFRVASMKAGRRVVDAAARKDWNEAYRSKLQEILNLELYRAARDAKEAGEAGRAYLRRFDTLAKRQWLGKLGTSGVGQWVVFDRDGAEVGAFDTMEQARAVWQQQPTGAEYRRTNGYMEQVFGILDGYSLRGVSNRQLRRKEQFRKWIQRSREAGEEPIIEDHVIDDLGERSWNDLTVTEQADVVNAVRNIETRAKLKDKLLKAAKEREMDEAREAITSSIVTNQPKPLQDEQSSGPLTTLLDAPLRFIDAARKDSHLAYAMDGYQDGGAVWEYFIRPRNEATTESELVHIQEAEAYRQLFKQWGKSKGMAATTIPGTTLKLRLEERIMLAAHWGNAEGRDRVAKRLRMTGHGLPDALAVIDSLDAADWQLINGMSLLVNKHWSDVAALEQRVTGIPPEKVQALPIVTAKHGVQPGGYFPLKYDERLSKKAGDLAAEMAARENARAVGARAQTRHGHTNLRAREIEGLAVRLDFDMVAEHLAEVVHDLSHREMLLDQNKLLRDEAIKDTIISRHGRRAYRELIDTAGSIANRGRTAGGALSPYAAKLRRGVSASVFTYQLTSALMNLTGFLNSLSRVGPLRMLGALGRVGMDAASMTSTMAWVDSKSGMMKARGGNVIREVGEVMREIGPGGKLQTFIRAGYWPMRQIQRVVDTVTWVGAYEQSMADLAKSGLPFEEAEAKAIAIADQIVTDTQGSARVGDLSAIERDGELSKMFTLFFGWMNTTQNITRTQVGRIIRNPTDPATLIGASAVILMTGPVQVVMTDIIRAVLRGDDRDDEERLQRFARQQAGFLLGQYVLARELSGPVEGGFDYSGPAALRAIVESAKLASRVAESGDVSELFGRPLANAIGAVTGLPTRAALQVADGWEQIQEGGEGIDGLRTVLFGKPLKDPR